MQKINFPVKKNITLLAIGPESAGNFAVCQNGQIYLSKNFGDLLDDKNFQNLKKSVLEYLKKNKLKPAVIMTDLHPLYRTTGLGKNLSKKFKARHIKVQHHLAHIFSAVGEHALDSKVEIQNSFLGIACDGTGYGLDGNIWGGEIFLIQKSKIKNQNDHRIPTKRDNAKLKINRIGKLENQTLIGGDLAIKEPARILIGILSKFLNHKEVFNYARKYYSKNQFEVLCNQFRQKFNCSETSSTGRILDAVSILLEFTKNQRDYKHAPIDFLEKNSTKPYNDIEPIIKITPSRPLYCEEKTRNNFPCYELNTTFLFEYLIKNIDKDKRRLAATSQLYIAQGLYQISQLSSFKSQLYFAGGMANNKIIASYLESKGAITNKKIPRGDAGLSFGQIIFYLLNYCMSTDSRN